MGQFYTVGGVRLHFSDSGEGTTVVFLHPTPLDGAFWQPLVARLKGIRAIAPDLRGHGLSQLGSDLPTGGFPPDLTQPVLGMDRLASDVLALLDQLEIPEAVFVGCSIGGYVALEIWRQVPHRVRGLALLCSKAQPDLPANLDRRVATIARARAGERAAIFDGMVQSLTGPTALAERPELGSELRSHMNLTVEALCAVQAGLAIRPDSVPMIPTISVPVLAVAGGEDPGVSFAEVEAFKAAPGGCEAHLIEKAGHFAACEQPDPMASIVAAWLEQFGRS